MGRLINVSNRVPLAKTAAPGGLAVGVLAAMRARGGLWFGWNGETSGQEPGEAEITVREPLTYATIPLPQNLYERYYSGFANGTLWPLFHYFLAGFRYDDQEYAAYEQANALFASRLLPLLAPGDFIWVHDYHLIPLAEKLHAQGARQPIGFFLHVPFPHFEVLRALPTFAEIVRALLAYDLVGFQTETDRGSFLGRRARPLGRAVRGRGRHGQHRRAHGPHRCLPHRGRRRRDRAERRQGGGLRAGAADDAESRRPAAHRRCRPPGLQQGAARALPGIPPVPRSFPEQIGQVTFLQIAPLGRQKVQAYAQIRDALEQSSGRTNGRFADADWTPIRYLNRNFPHATLMGFLRAAQVCLVTALRDGMNLVAKEFIAAQDPDDPGVLVLSNRAGAACELTEALLINPYDTRGIARAIQRALTMPLAERRARHATSLATLRENDIHRWHTRFIDDLLAARARPATRRTAGSTGPDFPPLIRGPAAPAPEA